MQPEYKKVTFQFPLKDYQYLKMTCARDGISVKDFLTKSAMKSIEELENKSDILAAEKAKKEVEEHGVISWEEMERRVGWDKL